MLLVKARLQAVSTDESASYDVRVYVNAQRIWRGQVCGHIRDQGFAVLLGHIAYAARNTKPGSQTVPITHCPACGKGIRRKHEKTK